MLSVPPVSACRVDNCANIICPASRIVRRYERPALRRFAPTRADPYPIAVPPHLQESARPRRDLEAELLVLVDDDALLGHDDGCLAVLPARVAPTGVVGVAEDQVVGAAEDAFGFDAVLLGRGEPAGLLLAPGGECQAAGEEEGRHPERSEGSA